MNELDELSNQRMLALDKIELNKKRVARSYNKKIRPKKFKEGDLVWKCVLPLKQRHPEWGKWSPTWEGPYVVTEVLKNGAYRYKNLEGEVYTDPINGLYLKRYYPTFWELKGF